MKWLTGVIILLAVSVAAAEPAWDLAFRVAADGGLFFGARGDSIGNGVELRRARVIVAGRSGIYDAKIDVDLAGNEVTLKDAFARAFVAPGLAVRAGNFRTPFGLEPHTSTRDLLFLERSLALSAFGPGRRVGLEVAYHGPRGRVALAAQGQDVNAEDDWSRTNQPLTLGGRATWLPWQGETGLVHLGLAGVWREPDGGDQQVRYSTRDEIHLNGLKFLDTDAIDRTEHVAQAGAELMVVRRGWRLQAEAALIRTARDSLCNLDFQGATVQLAHRWGAIHDYRPDKAVMGRLKPGTAGAWEVGLRWSTVDLNDHDIHGGQGTVWTTGVSWYPDRVVRLTAAWLHVDHDESADGAGSLPGDLDYDALMIRCRFAL